MRLCTQSTEYTTSSLLPPDPEDFPYFFKLFVEAYILLFMSQSFSSAAPIFMELTFFFGICNS